jgi:hypothetical protein
MNTEEFKYFLVEKNGLVFDISQEQDKIDLDDKKIDSKFMNSIK